MLQNDSFALVSHYASASQEGQLKTKTTQMILTQREKPKTCELKGDVTAQRCEERNPEQLQVLK